MRRLERQALVGGCERRLHFSEWSAGPHGQHQFAGIVGDDSTVFARVEQVTDQLAAKEILGAAAADAQAAAVRDGVVDATAGGCDEIAFGAHV
jgi:hypothetical protein